MYPLVTNDRSLTAREVFCAHKRQPEVEKRFCQAKSTLQIAPVLLKNEGRVEALFFCYFLALLLCALIERELRLAMARGGHLRASSLSRGTGHLLPHFGADIPPLQPC